MQNLLEMLSDLNLISVHKVVQSEGGERKVFVTKSASIVIITVSASILSVFYFLFCVYHCVSPLYCDCVLNLHKLTAEHEVHALSPVRLLFQQNVKTSVFYVLRC